MLSIGMYVILEFMYGLMVLSGLGILWARGNE